MYGETGLVSFLFTQQKLVLQYWLNIIQLEIVNALKLCIMNCMDLATLVTRLGAPTCAHFQTRSDVRETCGILKIYTTEFQNMGHLKSKINTALENSYIREWACQINSRTYACQINSRTYTKFKSNFRTESYLTSLGVKKYQMNIARFPPVTPFTNMN